MPLLPESISITMTWEVGKYCIYGPRTLIQIVYINARTRACFNWDEFLNKISIASILCLQTSKAIGYYIGLSVKRHRILNSISRFKIKTKKSKTYGEDCPNLDLSNDTTTSFNSFNWECILQRGGGG
jgi:hypothetical protein